MEKDKEIKMAVTPEQPVEVHMTFYEAWVTLVVMQAFTEYGVTDKIPKWKIDEWMERVPGIQALLIEAMGGEEQMYKTLEAGVERAKNLKGN